MAASAGSLLFLPTGEHLISPRALARALEGVEHPGLQPDPIPDLRANWIRQVDDAARDLARNRHRRARGIATGPDGGREYLVEHRGRTRQRYGPWKPCGVVRARRSGEVEIVDRVRPRPAGKPIAERESTLEAFADLARRSLEHLDAGWASEWLGGALDRSVALRVPSLCNGAFWVPPWLRGSAVAVVAALNTAAPGAVEWLDLHPGSRHTSAAPRRWAKQHTLALLEAVPDDGGDDELIEELQRAVGRLATWPDDPELTGLAKRTAELAQRLAAARPETHDPAFATGEVIEAIISAYLEMGKAELTTSEIADHLEAVGVGFGGDSPIRHRIAVRLNQAARRDPRFSRTGDGRYRFDPNAGSTQ